MSVMEYSLNYFEAAELATSHIAVNAYAPGYIPTPGFSSYTFLVN